MPGSMRHALANWKAASRFVWGFGLLVRALAAIGGRRGDSPAPRP